MLCHNHAGTGTAALAVGVGVGVKGVALGISAARIAARSRVGRMCQLYRLRGNDPEIPQTHLRVAAPSVANDIKAILPIGSGLTSRRLRLVAFRDLFGTLDSHE